MDAPPATDTIVVIAPRLPEARGEQVYSTVPIDQAALEQALRLDQALAQAPGASLFRRNDSGAANPTVQGLSLRAIGPSGAGRALVTLDGVPQHDPFGGWVIWGALPPETIARALVIRGGGAGPYGAGALTGTVALEERAAPGLVASAEAGDLGFRRVAGMAAAHGENTDALLAASAEHSDGWIPVRKGRGAADTPLWRDSVAGVARVQARRGRVLLSARLNGYSESRGAGLAGANSTADGAAASLTLVAAPEADHAGWRLQAWARGSDMSNDFVSVAADRGMTNPASVQYETPAFGWGLNTALRFENGEIGADVRSAEGETHERFLFSGGAFTRSRIAGGETLSAGVYAEAWRDIGPLLLSGGARLDWWRASEGVRRETNPTLELRPEDSSAWAPTARLGLRRAVGAHFLRAAAYAGFRPPTLNELHRPFRVGNDVTEANAALEPERLYGADAAVGHDGADFSWSIGAFAVRLDDPITNVTEGDGPRTFPPGVFVPAGGVFRVRRNAGHIDAIGAEIDTRGALGDALEWRAALSYTDARVEGGVVAPQLTGLRPAQSPAWTATAGVSWRAWPGGEISADARYESERFEDDLNSRRLAAATSLDLRVSQRVAEPLTMFIALDNALDSNIETGETADGITSLAAPRVFRVGLRAAR